MAKDTKPILVRLPPDLHEQIRREAEDKERPMTQVVKETLRQKFPKNKSKSQRSKPR